MSRYVKSSPHFFRPVGRSMLLGLAVLLLLAALVPAPLETPADPAHAPNPAKSAWFLLWIQELVSYSTLAIYVAVALAGVPRGPALAAGAEARARPLAPPRAPAARGGRARGGGSRPRPHRRGASPQGARLAARAALLIAALLLGGCLKAPSTAGRETGCRSCHEAHYVREGACRDCHRGNEGARRVELAHERLLTGRAAEHRLAEGLAVREGQRLVETLACRRCHAIGGKGNRLATSLDAVAWRREQAQLVSSIREPVENMPRFGLDEEQAEAIVAFLLRSGSPDPPQDTYRVHFTRGASPSPTVFEKECGGCHRFLGPAGPVGTGSAGPNLSGLFTPFYPPTAPGERPWTDKALADWLRNPRASRAHSTMPPVALGEDDLRKVTAELGGPGAGTAPR